MNYSASSIRKLFLQASKIAVGSCAAIYIASAFHLEYWASAGSITLLTLVTTKWETMKLSVYRLITFAVAALLSIFIFSHLSSEWISYGIYVFLIVIICDVFGWRATVSVNAVIGTHFLMEKEFGYEFILNELMLVVIGISIAIILNLFQGNRVHKKEIIQNMRDTEKQLQMILGELSAYLFYTEMQRNVWDDIRTLEQQLQEYIREAYEYQDNTFHSHPQYYIDYFEMRMKQCNVLHNLHYEMKKIRRMPKQSKVIADYILYMMDYVVETNFPAKQIEELERIFEAMKKEPLPADREEFESRAMLYHILMDLEEFLIFKKRFVENLDERQLKEYWVRQSVKNSDVIR